MNLQGEVLGYTHTQTHTHTRARTSPFEVCVCVRWHGLCLRSPPTWIEPSLVQSTAVSFEKPKNKKKALNPAPSLFHVFIWYGSSSPYCHSIQLLRPPGLQPVTTPSLTSGAPWTRSLPLNVSERGKKKKSCACSATAMCLSPLLIKPVGAECKLMQWW